MKVQNITHNLPRKLLLTSAVAATLSLSSGCINKQDRDCFEPDRIETVNAAKSEDIVTKIIRYDTDRLKQRSERNNPESKIPANIPARILAGGALALIGGVITACKRDNAKTGAIAGGLLGSLLPGISVSAMLTGGTFGLLSLVAGIFSKGNKAIGITTATIGAAAVAALMFL